ncbi:class Ib ribonucleoside-diphosphate reductase assembly flavoprotein NrdI [Levilactobacillus acidifarinae]|uniref:Flavoprotein NrdI n=1 Tax=Levilactobacillus acidifarinae DSM 19394 = JCM 15949 TaxID=1423715 RepID=A0A0R1LNA4_9LACO|nr:class Ib ribonucleoside-diphosphate reductase assembly flavoprotein NrdI [Levilactobacillus acidifarinae]KRK94169.1 flavoprotein NrdI [Levilactobacillus acidifarinae DSM 19394]GEO70165.1 ribonucleotide reductase assembly protein NrdI [Levilactobacillus acidifarinae]
MQPLRILFISIEGNTRNFVEHLTAYALAQHEANADLPTIEATEISDASDFTPETTPYFCFVPTYLNGGNGIDNGVKELMTNVLGEYIDFGANAQHLVGVVGSGNRNFNEQYCLTAKRYAKKFDAPFVANYELRGVPADEKRVYQALVTRMKEVVTDD